MSNNIERSESETPIIKYNYIDRGWQPPTYGEYNHLKQMEEHIEKYIGKIESVYNEIMSDLIHLDVFYIKPTSKRKYHTFVTSGMSYLSMNPMKGAEEDTYAELMVYLPESWSVSDKAFKDDKNYWPIRWLKMLARFPHVHNTWLGFAHTMPNGNPPQPLTEKTKLCGIILLPPIDVNKEFLSLKINEQKVINYYCMMPIYKEEMDYKLKYGYSDLLDKLDKDKISQVVDINRKNTCKKSLRTFWRELFKRAGKLQHITMHLRKGSQGISLGLAEEAFLTGQAHHIVSSGASTTRE